MTTSRRELLGRAAGAAAGVGFTSCGGGPPADEQGIGVEALSINPNFWDQAERDQAAAVVKLQNEKLAELCAKTPDRFVGLASVSLAYTDLAVEALDTAVKKLRR